MGWLTLGRLHHNLCSCFAYSVASDTASGSGCLHVAPSFRFLRELHIFRDQLSVWECSVWGFSAEGAGVGWQLKFWWANRMLVALWRFVFFFFLRHEIEWVLLYLLQSRPNRSCEYQFLRTNTTTSSLKNAPQVQPATKAVGDLHLLPEQEVAASKPTVELSQSPVCAYNEWDPLEVSIYFVLHTVTMICICTSPSRYASC